MSTPDVIAAIQILIALAFVSIPMVRARYGARAQAAAEASVEGQGIRGGLLTENGLRFDAGGHETAAPVAIALVIATMAALNLAAAPFGETVTWIVQPLVFLVNAAILHSQLNAARSVRAAFAKRGDAELERIDVEAFLDAATRAFPRWVIPGLQNARHAIAFGGSIAVLLMLAFG